MPNQIHNCAYVIQIMSGFYFKVCILRFIILEFVFLKTFLSFLVVYPSADIFSVTVLLMLKTGQFLGDGLTTFKSCTTD